MGTEEIVARLNAGAQLNLTPGSTAKAKLTNQEIAIATGMVHSSFDHALMLAVNGAGLGGYSQGPDLISLNTGICKIAWGLWAERKRPGKLTVQINNRIAILALDEFMDPRVVKDDNDGKGRTHTDRAAIVGVSRAQWFKVYAEHFADVMRELQTREQRALSTVRRMLREK